MSTRIDCLPTTHPTETATWTPVTSSPNATSGKNPMDVVLLGVNDAGQSVTPAYTPEGHAEVAIHDPLLPFGSVHTENLLPIFQVDGVYGVNLGQLIPTVSGSGVATASESVLKVSTGTTIYSQGVLQSRKRLRYRPGQGAIGRFAGYFSTPAASSYQVMGLGHPEDGYYFGYNGTAFGILRVAYNVREIQTLTIATASTTNQNATVTLNGTPFTVAVTNATSTKNAYEISTASYGIGWYAEQIGTTVRFLSNTVGNKTGAFTLSATTFAGTFAETVAGSTSPDVFIPQSSWNADPLDGTGPSGVTLDPTKGNVYQINIQYLGFGVVNFKVLVVPPNRNNPIWVTVHTIKNPNTLTRTHVSNPSFPFTMAAYSAGSTADLTVGVGSMAGFVEGQRRLTGNRFSYFASSNAVTDAAYRALFTIRNDRVYNSKTNQSVINLIDLQAALKHINPCIIYVIRNATLAGTPSFTSFSTLSCSTWDTAATTCTFSTNDQLVWSGHMGDTGQIDHLFPIGDLEEVTIQPGETLTVAARAVSGNPSVVTASLNTREDQ